MEPGDILKENSDSIVFARHAEQLAREGDAEGAEAVLRKGLERHPRYAAGHAVLASVLMQKGDKDQAGRELEQAVALDPGNPNDHMSLGKYYIKAGRGEAAVNVLAVVKRFEPDNVAVDDFCRKAEVVRASNTDLNLDSQSKEAISAMVSDDKPAETLVQGFPEQVAEAEEPEDAVAETIVFQQEEELVSGTDQDEPELPDLSIQDDSLTVAPQDINEFTGIDTEESEEIFEELAVAEDDTLIAEPETENIMTGEDTAEIAAEVSSDDGFSGEADAEADMVAAFTCDEEPEVLDDDEFDELIRDNVDDVADVEENTADDAETQAPVDEDGSFEEDLTGNIEVFSEREDDSDALQPVDDDAFDALLAGDEPHAEVSEEPAGADSRMEDEAVSPAAEDVDAESVDIGSDLPSFEEEVAGLGEDRPAIEPVGAGSGDRPEAVDVLEIDENDNFDLSGVSFDTDEPVLTEDERAELEALESLDAGAQPAPDSEPEDSVSEPGSDGLDEIIDDQENGDTDAFISELSKEELEVLSDTNNVEPEDAALTHETREGIDYSDILEGMNQPHDIEDALDEAQDSLSADLTAETISPDVYTDVEENVLPDNDILPDDTALPGELIMPEDADGMESTTGSDAIINEFTSDDDADVIDSVVIDEAPEEQTVTPVTEDDISDEEIDDFDLPEPGMPIHGLEIGPDDELIADDINLEDDADSALSEAENVVPEHDDEESPDEESTRYVENMIKNAPEVGLSDDEPEDEIEVGDEASLDDLISAYEHTLQSEKPAHVALSADDTPVQIERVEEEYGGDEGDSILSDSIKETNSSTEDEETATMAEIYVSQGLTEEAIRIYGSIVARQPDNEKAFNRLKELREKLEEDAED